MERDHRESYGRGTSSGVGYGSTCGVVSAAKTDGSPMSSGKMTMRGKQEPEASGMDEQFAVLGYRVRSADMAKVAEKLEQLEMVMGSAQEEGISHLASDTVHYDPSDMSAWVQSMLSEFNNLPGNIDAILDPAESSSTTTTFNFSNSNQEIESRSQVFTDDSEYDLRAIPGVAAYPQTQSDLTSESETTRKRYRTSTGYSNSVQFLPSPSPSPMAVSSASASGPTRPVLLVDSQEAGIRLVHTLLACAEAVQQDNLKLADTLLKHIGMLAASQVGAMRKVATYFAQALARRIYTLYPTQDFPDSICKDLLEMHFYESSPYLKFAHFTANQAILEAFASSSRVHVIDFALKQGMQWPALIQALALRPGGPPAFRLTGIGPPHPDNTDALQQVGWKLAHLAETIGVKFEFRGYVCNSLADLEPSMLDIRPAEVETVAVNSVFELHRLLARPGASEKVLDSIKAMKPKIVTVVEQETNHNGPVFLDRFTEALYYYSTLFDSLEGSSPGVSPTSEDVVMSELYLGSQICNVVACEGPERVERHETLSQWRESMSSAGFDPVHLGSNAFKQASMLLALFAGGDGYRVEENNGCLMLGWHTRQLIATSAWKPSENSRE